MYGLRRADSYISPHHALDVLERYQRRFAPSEERFMAQVSRKFPYLGNNPLLYTPELDRMPADLWD